MIAYVFWKALHQDFLLLLFLSTLVAAAGSQGCALSGFRWPFPRPKRRLWDASPMAASALVFLIPRSSLRSFHDRLRTWAGGGNLRASAWGCFSASKVYG